MEELRKTSVYGIRIERTFRQAATKFLLYFQHKRSIGRYAQSLKIRVFPTTEHNESQQVPQISRRLRPRKEAICDGSLNPHQRSIATGFPLERWTVTRHTDS
jgi:hypothetical protein